VPNDIERVPIDPITLKVTGADQKALADALAKAFPDPNALNQMLTARLDQPLNAIAAPYPLTAATFEVVTFYLAKGHVLRLIAAARASQPDNPALSLVAERFHLSTPTPPQPQLEKIVKKTSVPFPVAVWRERLAKREVCVCRIELPASAGLVCGTGFLVGADLVLTNHHVMAPAISHQAGTYTGKGLSVDPKKVIVRFDYKQLDDKTPVNAGVEVRLADDWLVDSSPPSAVDVQVPRVDTPALEELDYALVRLAEPIGAAPIALGKDTDAGSKPRGWIELPEAEWPFADHTSLFIIQHPDGSPMALALDLEARMQVNANKTRVTYQTGTQPGSSGAPCFNQFWDLIALHHAGDPLYPELAPGAFNEGIPIHRIVERLNRSHAADGLTIV
jgi:hypothetical protein